jgi:hypothetical protein
VACYYQCIRDLEKETLDTIKHKDTLLKGRKARESFEMKQNFKMKSLQADEARVRHNMV